ncbi:GDSL-type esterase/lipase family protein [Actinoalloteichus caeruleus]|uniref:GDSL-type esterase/lipase family protein n=1 Tax=Actinoalloteichus cyanogriseus TaxID=2893586 RepID=UPI003AAA6638
MRTEMMVRRRWFAAVTGMSLLVAGCAMVPETTLERALPAGAELAEEREITTFTASPKAAQEREREFEGFTDNTVRTRMRVSSGGSAVRVRLDNTFSPDELHVGRVTIALATDREGGINPSSLTELRVERETSFTLAPGESVYTDLARMEVPDGADVAVSFYFPGPTGRVTTHSFAGEHSRIATGDHTENVNGRPFQVEEKTMSTRPLVGAITVVPETATGTLVTIGGSMTDGVGVDFSKGSDRWSDVLSRRIVDEYGPRRLSVANAGMSGNRMLTSSGYGGQRVLERYDRDVLDLPGADAVLFAAGINDMQHPPQTTDLDLLMATFEEFADRTHERGMLFYMATITPFEGWFSWEPHLEENRQEINRRIRASDKFDGVVDFDAAVRDPDHPSRILPEWDVHDGIHPNSAGAVELANAVDLDMILGDLNLLD